MFRDNAIVKTMPSPALSGRGIQDGFARKRRRVRHEGKGYSQEARVLDAGVDRSHVSGLERDVESARIEMVDKFGGVLGAAATATLLHRASRPNRKTGLPSGTCPRQEPAQSDNVREQQGLRNRPAARSLSP